MAYVGRADDLDVMSPRVTTPGLRLNFEMEDGEPALIELASLFPEVGVIGLLNVIFQGAGERKRVPAGDESDQ